MGNGLIYIMSVRRTEGRAYEGRRDKRTKDGGMSVRRMKGRVYEG